MFNMEVSSDYDAMKLEDQYLLKWYCNGQPVKRVVRIITDNLMQAKDPKAMVKSYVRAALETGVIDLHADDHCAWCFAAKHSLEIIFRNDDIGVAPPTPFWKVEAEPLSADAVDVAPFYKTSKWEEIGHTTKSGIASGDLIGISVGPFSINNGAVSTGKFTQSIEYAYKVYKENPAAGPADSYILSQKSHELPGASIKVKYPCADDCSLGQFYNDEGGGAIRSIIMHLNDCHKWTREAIADWLDAIDDPENGIDLAFKVPEKEES